MILQCILIGNKIPWFLVHTIQMNVQIVELCVSKHKQSIHSDLTIRIHMLVTIISFLSSYKYVYRSINKSVTIYHINSFYDSIACTVANGSTAFVIVNL